MNYEETLLMSLHADPGDDMTWLVLADLLEEQGRTDESTFLRLCRALRGVPEGPQRDQDEQAVQALLLAGVRPCVPALTNSIGMKLALIPAGSFWLGSPHEEEGRYDDEGPRRLIEISKPFYLGVYPVTQGEYETVVQFNPSAFCGSGSLADHVAGVDTSRHPVERVSWDDAMKFCRTLTDYPQEREARRVYSLPTETQWEYACRGGASLSSPFIFGKTITPKVANYRYKPRGGRGRSRLTTAVGKYPANAFGLYDMHGNVWEWCADWYDTDIYTTNPPSDPTGPKRGDRRNVRGGTYNLEARRLRSADRSSFAPDHRDTDLGFRVLCPWTPPDDGDEASPFVVRYAQTREA